MATTSKILTYEEWLRLPEVEGVEEVVNGQIRKMPPNKVIHADTVENLADMLKAQVDRRTVQVRVSTFGLVIRREPRKRRQWKSCCSKTAVWLRPHCCAKAN